MLRNLCYVSRIDSMNFYARKQMHLVSVFLPSIPPTYLIIDLSLFKRNSICLDLRTERSGEFSQSTGR